MLIIILSSGVLLQILFHFLLVCLLQIFTTSLYNFRNKEVKKRKKKKVILKKREASASNFSQSPRVGSRRRPKRKNQQIQEHFSKKDLGVEPWPFPQIGDSMKMGGPVSR